MFRGINTGGSLNFCGSGVFSRTQEAGQGFMHCAANFIIPLGLPIASYRKFLHSAQLLATGLNFQEKNVRKIRYKI